MDNTWSIPTTTKVQQGLGKFLQMGISMQGFVKDG